MQRVEEQLCKHEELETRVVQQELVITQLRDKIACLETTLETAIMRLELVENAQSDMQGNVDTVRDSLEDVQMTTHAR